MRKIYVDIRKKDDLLKALENYKIQKSVFDKYCKSINIEPANNLNELEENYKKSLWLEKLENDINLKHALKAGHSPQDLYDTQFKPMPNLLLLQKFNSINYKMEVVKAHVPDYPFSEKSFEIIFVSREGSKLEKLLQNQIKAYNEYFELFSIIEGNPQRRNIGIPNHYLSVKELGFGFGHTLYEVAEYNIDINKPFTFSVKEKIIIENDQRKKVKLKLK